MVAEGGSDLAIKYFNTTLTYEKGCYVSKLTLNPVFTTKKNVMY